MTNPYSHLEHALHAEDYLPAEEQIKPTSPEATKGIMEVWRDTANQLDAERMISKRAKADYASTYENYVKEQTARLDLEDELRKEKELKKLAIQELNGFKEQSQKQLEKLRRHRDELAEKVMEARKMSGSLSEWLDGHDNGDVLESPVDVLRQVATSLHEVLGVHEGKEADNATN